MGFIEDTTSQEMDRIKLGLDLSADVGDCYTCVLDLLGERKHGNRSTATLTRSHRPDQPFGHYSLTARCSHGTPADMTFAKLFHTLTLQVLKIKIRIDLTCRSLLAC